MNLICVDDEELILNLTVSLCRDLPRISEAEGFIHAADALEWLEKNTADIAILDINMPDIDGITLAEKIRSLRPDIEIIFLTGYTEYALQAFSVHASGYLCKPITIEDLQREVEFAASRIDNKVNHLKALQPHILVKTFGGFDVFVDNKLVSFQRARAKCLFAFLVDRRGGTITRAEAFSILWEKGMYDRAMQKQLDVVIRSLRNTLAEHGIEDVFELSRGSLRIVPEKLDCDLFRFLKNDPLAIEAYHGEYMTPYSWGSTTEAYLDSLKKNMA